MKKINNKGVTLVELIVSFAIVGVAIIYFFQTLYTVKNIYTIAKNGTQEFVDKAYALRVVDAYIDEKGYSSLSTDSDDNVCKTYKLACDKVSKSNSENVYTINLKKGSTTWVTLYKYHE